jgi:hypothetical protein
MVRSIQITKRPVWLTAYWRMMGSGNSVCKRPGTCSRGISSAASLPLFSFGVSHFDLTLWEHYKVKMCDDLCHRLIAQGCLQLMEEDVFNYGLHLLENILIKSGKCLSNFDPMTTPQQQWEVLEGNFFLREQLDYDPEEMRRATDLWYPEANNEQRATFNKVMDSVNNNKGKIIFLHSVGGSGKTYVCNAIAAAVHADAKVALCVAPSAIAVLLLHGGRTAHSHLKIPIPILPLAILQ